MNGDSSGVEVEMGRGRVSLKEVVLEVGREREERERGLRRSWRREERNILCPHCYREE